MDILIALSFQSTNVGHPSIASQTLSKIPWQIFQTFLLNLFHHCCMLICYLLAMWKKAISECWFLYPPTLLNLNIVLELFWYSLVVFIASMTNSLSCSSNQMPLFLSLAWVLSLAKAWSTDLNGRGKSGIHVMSQTLEKRFSTHPHSLLAASLFYMLSWNDQSLSWSKIRNAG